MAEAEHSLFSASGAEGWSVCYGKPAMEYGRKTSSVFADEGTAAHKLAEWVMDARLNGRVRTAADFIGHKIKVGQRTFVVDSAMAEHVDEYVDRFWLMSDGAEVRLSEQRIYYHEDLGTEKKLAFGTSDGVAILFDQPALKWTDPVTEEVRRFPAGDELQVHDLKYGMGVIVYADALQMRPYGAGTLREWQHVARFTRVRLVIHQPRKDHLSEIVITPAELIASVQALRPAVPKVLDAWRLAQEARDEEGQNTDRVPGDLMAKGYLKASDKGCRFCDAKAICPEYIASVAEAIGGKRLGPEDFEDLTVPEPAEVRDMGGNFLAAAFAKLDMIHDFASAVRAEIDRRILNKGEKFDGLKVVAGKRGKRQWRDVGEAEALAASLPKPLQELVYKRELRTAPQIIDKALKTSPHTAAKFAAMIVQPEGRPAVVPTSDSRPAIAHKSLVDDFEDLTKEQPAPDRRADVGSEPHPFRR